MSNVQENIRKKRLSRIIRFIPALIWMGVIFYSSSKTGDEVSRFLPLVQSLFPFIKSFNFMHIISYLVLAMTLDFGFGKYSTQIKYKILIVLLCILYGITDEFHQMFVGDRTPDIVDIRNDGIGALLWVLLIEVKFINHLWNKLSREK